MTLPQAATKSRTNFSFASSLAYTSASARSSEFEPKTSSAAVAVQAAGGRLAQAARAPGISDLQVEAEAGVYSNLVQPVPQRHVEAVAAVEAGDLLLGRERGEAVGVGVQP